MDQIMDISALFEVLSHDLLAPYEKRAWYVVSHRTARAWSHASLTGLSIEPRVGDSVELGMAFIRRA